MWCPQSLAYFIPIHMLVFVLFFLLGLPDIVFMLFLVGGRCDFIFSLTNYLILNLTYKALVCQLVIRLGKEPSFKACALYLWNLNESKDDLPLIVKHKTWRSFRF